MMLVSGINLFGHAWRLIAITCAGIITSAVLGMFFSDVKS